MATEREEIAAQVPEPEAATSELDAMGLNEDGTPKEPTPPKDGGKPEEGKDDDDGKPDPNLTPEQQEAKRHRSAQRRINKAVREQREAERKAAAAEALLQETRQQNERLLAAIERAGGKKADDGAAPDKPSAPPVDEKPPKYEDFDTLDEYLEARDAWRDKKNAKPAEPKAPEKPDGDGKPPPTPEQELRFERFAVIKERAGKDEAYNQAVFKDLTITNVMADSILDQDNFEEVIDYFVENPDAARKVAQLEASGRKDKIAGAIAYIAETLAADDDAAPSDEDDQDFEGDPDPAPDKPDAEGTPPPRKPVVSSAPPPIPRTVRPVSGSRVNKDAEDMSQDEYVEARKSGKLR